MSHVTPLHHEDKAHLFKLHHDFQKKARYTGCSTAAVSFLIIGALVVITCSCLCLMLPGVNVIQHVILPGVLPGSGALFLSLPFIYLAFTQSREKNKVRRELIKFNLALMTHYKVKEMKKKPQVAFLKENLFDRRWTKEYSGKVIRDLKEWFPKEKEGNKEILEVLDKVQAKIYKKKKKS